jgi:hypothetical protein
LKRKLFALNLLLAALLGAAGWQIRERWRLAREREQAVLAQQVPPAPAPEVPELPKVAPVPAASYLEVAQGMIFSRDRNPNVVVEEKPPEPVPPFPFAYGVLDFGGGPTVFMSEKAGAPQKSYRVGDMVGPFKIAALTRDEITLEWKDKTFQKPLAELKPKPSEAERAATAAAPPPVEAPKVQSVAPDEVLANAQKQMSSDGAPGINVGAQVRACAPGDNSPPGTIQGGYRKVVTATPFGQSCRWEPVR